MRTSGPDRIPFVLVSNPPVPKQSAVAQTRILEPTGRSFAGMVHRHMGCQVAITTIRSSITVRAPHCMAAVIGDLVCVAVSVLTLAIWKYRHGRSSFFA